MLLSAKREWGTTKMTKLLTDLGAALAWIWMTPDEARRLLRINDRAAYATADITFEVRSRLRAA